MFASEYSPDLAQAADVIIVGSGLAAVPIALGLSNKDRRVLIVEGGDTGESAQASALTETYDYGAFSDGYWARHWVRALGGTSRRWDGWVAPLDARDFQQSNVDVEWPLTLDDLRPSYVQAAAFLGRPAAIIRAGEPFLDTPFLYKPFSRGDALRVPAAFSDRFRTDPNIVVITRHTAVRLATGAARNTITGVHLTDFSCQHHLLPVSPNQVLVIACGGLGNAQILMQPADGSEVPVGNESGLAGKFLMEHPHAYTCADAFIAADTLPKPGPDFGDFTDAFVLGDDDYKRHNLLACTLSVTPVSERDGDQADQLRVVFETQFKRRLGRYVLTARSGQEPDSSNGVTLVNDLDWAGSYKLEVHNSFSRRDLRSIETTARLLGEALAARRIGTVKIDNASVYRRVTGGGHTMGTTRMGTSDGNSVCNRESRVHGYNNLYLAGSSIFPTSGASNPTLTIVALSLRLTDHLLERDQ